MTGTGLRRCSPERRRSRSCGKRAGDIPSRFTHSLAIMLSRKEISRRDFDLDLTKPTQRPLRFFIVSFLGSLILTFHIATYLSSGPAAEEYKLAFGARKSSSAHCYTSPEALREQLTNGNYTLTLVGLFKEEGLALRQWVEHNIGEGVDHFVLVDNNDPENENQDACSLRPLVDAGVVTLIQNDSDYIQIPEMDRLLNLFAPRSKWLMSIDVDEFVYARPNAPLSANSIPEFLDRLPSTIATVLLPRKTFLTTSFVQSESVVSASRVRERFGKQTGLLPKWIVRASSFKRYTIHWPLVQREAFKQECFAVLPDMSCMHYLENLKQYLPSSNHTLHLNHYGTRSLQGFVQRLGRSAVSSEEASTRYRGTGLGRLSVPGKALTDRSEIDNELIVRHMERSQMYTEELDVAMCCGGNAGGIAPPSCPHHIFDAVGLRAQHHAKAWKELCRRRNKAPVQDIIRR